MTNAMGGTNLHTPSSIFQHMMNQQNTSQQPETWMQIPQVPPMSIPWSVPSLQQPELVRFTGGPSFESILHQKRKLETCDLLDMRQTKQFITEEKMAAHFKGLHISSNYQQSSVPSTSTADSQPVNPRELNMELELDTANADQIKTGPRLVLSEELKRIQHEPILPNSLLSKLERPSMALVLWEPPSKHLRIFPTRDTPTPIPNTSDDNNNNDNNNNNNNNNNEAIADLNQTISSNSSIFEPMEL
ncbi:rho GTPase-activating protein gacM-like isoform X1 [Bombus affinis]|uniref:rho GTPase-activating protein gacM-like isoform X1 n=2 Tax=Bombus affinis TaxID=309941 RepID=UPI0021B7C15B|nr:rho GTPase-activating protein gacM-like isoform X1 [Bombus affinis]XP_050595833.1 rho GTPase-activating protein gacM-like isoform X1 [Bombus affinis]XP_050595834.1 rho GTPase-activating protein gacM-like isoform X1 [Bombus affinis]XP_050595835.1 rho GTPase-activating protein gacM-like isoform X1 [Bombus affinis]